MAISHSLSVKALLWAALTFGATAARTSQADGLTTQAQQATASSGTVLVGGTTSTYRVIPTLPASIDETPPVLPNIHDPKAIDAQNACSGYQASDVHKHKFGFSATLKMAGKACNVYGTDVDTLDLKVQYQSANRLRVRIRPSFIDSSNMSYYILSSKYLYKPTFDEDANMTAPTNDLQFIWTNKPSFGFAVLRKSTGDMLFNTMGTKLVYENQFIEFKTALPENYNLYGLGESIHGLRLGNNFTKTMWNADIGDTTDANIYGTHPFYLDTRYYQVDEKTGNMTLVTSETTDPESQYTSYSHGVFLRNAHGQEILLRPDALTWRTLGGSMDLYFLSGPTQPEVTQQYQRDIIGTPTMQQYWTLGYHQCRWGYKNVSDLEYVVNNMRKYEIPMETIWNDIDYMDQYRDFTVDEVRYGYEEFGAFLEKLHSNGQHYVPIVDAAIYHPNPNNASDAYDTFTRGDASDVWLKNAAGDTYIGAVWPGYTVFMDWRAEKAQQYWNNEVRTWHKKLDFDGLWLDMSEASSFCVGSCGDEKKVTQNPVHPPFALPGEPGSVIYEYPEGFGRTNHSEYKSASSASSRQASIAAATATSTSSQAYLRTTPTAGVRSLNYPPYVLNNYNGALGVHGLAPDALHADGTSNYDIHNLYGHDHLKATHDSLLAVYPKKRPFVIARSNFAGSGKYAGHWGGDNYSLFYYMAMSIPQALSFAMEGISMFGVDTCGFARNTDAELCSRWMALSAFFPFYRNHNTLTANPQEPYVWESVTVASKAAMNIRYAILPYMYTLMYQAHNSGSTVMRALQWEFPNEPALAGADRQFMLGSALMITPVLNAGMTTVNGVFPGSGMGTVWYDWYNQTAIESTRGENKTIEAPVTHIPLYVRGGSVVPMQQPKYTTSESRNTPWSLLVAMDMEGSATGQLYLDDGESIEPEATRVLDMTVTGNSLYVSGVGKYRDSNALSKVTILGVPKAPTGATLNGKKLSNVSYDSDSKVVSITGLEDLTEEGAWNADWQLAWTF